MEDVDLRHAKEHLEELIERARRGEDVRISDPKLGTVRLSAVPPTLPSTVPLGPRVTDTMPPFVPLKEKRKLGRLQGKIPPPLPDFFEPMSEEELKDWYGED